MIPAEILKAIYSYGISYMRDNCRTLPVVLLFVGAMYYTHLQDEQHINQLTDLVQKNVETMQNLQENVALLVDKIKEEDARLDRLENRVYR